MSHFSLPTLKYGYADLEPHISATIMELHHTKHHRGYVKKLNLALENLDEVPQTLEELLRNVDNYPPSTSRAIRNHGGGHYNHALFWETLTPQGGQEPTDGLLNAINRDFSSMTEFKRLFSQEAGKLFGAGWTWLCVDEEGLLHIRNTPNQDNPLMYGESYTWTPLLGLDVWEHAYYLQYKNERARYIEAWWNVVNWDFVEKRYNNTLR